MTLVGTIHQHVQGMPGAPRWVVPTSGTFRTPFFYRLLVCQDKNLYIPPEPIDHRIAEKSSVLFSCYFLSDPIYHGRLKLLQGDKFFKNVINPYLWEGVLHLRDVPCPKGTGTMEARLEAMEEDVFRCKGMVEHGLNAKSPHDHGPLP